MEPQSAPFDGPADPPVASPVGNPVGNPADDLTAAVAAVVIEPVWSLTDSQRCDVLRKIQSAQDSLDAAKTMHLQALVH